jgi:hypothetical protein
MTKLFLMGLLLFSSSVFAQSQWAWTGYGFISTAGFTEDERSRLLYGLNTLSFASQNVYVGANAKVIDNYESYGVPPGYTNPYFHSVVGYLWGLHKGDDRPGAAGYTSFNNIAYINSSGINSPITYLASIIAHEADHHRYGYHSCGVGADIDDESTYGLHAYTLSQLANHPNVSAWERYSAAANARYIAENRMCGNSVSRDKIINALNSNTYPQQPAYQPNPWWYGDCSSGNCSY